MSEKVIVKFTKPWRGYSPGEIAGFDESVVEALVGGGVASHHVPASAAASATTALPEKRPKAGDKKVTSRAGASKVPVAEPQTPAVALTSALPDETLDPSGDPGVDENADGAPGAGDSEPGTGAEGEPGSTDDDDDDGKP